MTCDVSPAEPGLPGALPHELAGTLTSRRALRSQRWVTAFQAVPRHVFVPRIFIQRGDIGGYEVLDNARPGQRQKWLKHVYTDEPLVTQLDGDTWLSSSSQPSLMAMMLEALDVTGPERVLEIGTGTGYNAALLSAGLGSGQVTSVDIDAGLVDLARVRLLGLGYAPVLDSADGAQGYRPAAPYDRIMATCSVPRIPAAWIEQTAPCGLIMANLYRELGGGALALLTVTDGQANGHFLPFSGGFMPTRTCAPANGLDLLARHKSEVGQRAATSVAATMLDDDAFGMLAALRLPGVQRLGLLPKDGPEQTWLLGRDGSWARQAVTDGSSVTQGGPARLWDLLEEIYREWTVLGCPARHEFGLTVIAGGHHRLWHERPAGPGWIL